MKCSFSGEEIPKGYRNNVHIKDREGALFQEQESGKELPAAKKKA
jgi:hypothetical protein